ncbi:MAG: periplasmic heavy metal sensor [Pseudomonadota bacterium]
MGRGVAIALAVSLGLNIFLGGFVVGRVIGHEPAITADLPPPLPHQAPPGSGPGAVSSILGNPRDLPPEARQIIRRTFREKRGTFLQEAQKVGTLRDNVVSAMTAEEFDRTEAQKALEALLAHSAEREEEAISVFLDIFSVLSLEERERLIANTQKRRGRLLEERMRRRGLQRPDEG